MLMVVDYVREEVVVHVRNQLRWRASDRRQCVDISGAS